MRPHQHKAFCTALPPPALLTPCSEPRELTHWRQMHSKAGLFSCCGCRTAVPRGSTGFLLWFERWDLHPKRTPSVGRSLQSAGCKQCSSCMQAAPSLGNTHSVGSCLWSNIEKLPSPQSGLLPLYAVYWKTPEVFTTGLPQSEFKLLQMPANLPLHFHTNDRSQQSYHCLLGISLHQQKLYTDIWKHAASQCQLRLAAHSKAVPRKEPCAYIRAQILNKEKGSETLPQKQLPCFTTSSPRFPSPQCKLLSFHSGKI